MGASATSLRPRDEASAATRRAILDAVEHLLASVGEEGLNIREVCKRAGVTPPTVYHHFGDKQTLVDRAVDDCFAAFDRSHRRRRMPADPVARLRWAFDSYVAYGRAHPEHYRLMFQRVAPRRTPRGAASYASFGGLVAAVAEAGRLALPVEDATAALWTAMHGATSLVIAGYLSPTAPAIGLVRDATITRLTRRTP